jgi:HprK-related kinase A
VATASVSPPTVGDLSAGDLRAELAGSGLYVRLGPFLLHLRTTIRAAADNFHHLYAEYPIEEMGIADFHVSVEPPPGLRRWVARQATFLLNGQTPFEPFPERLATPLLEWGLNWCVSAHAHQYLLIHAAVVERDGHALILPGPPGSGKSTLCAALIHDGWRLLSDEHTLVRVDDSEIVPFPRPVSLKDASIDIVREIAGDRTMGPRFTDTRKGTLSHLRAPSESIARWGERARPACVVFVRYRRGEDTRWEEQGKADGFYRLADNSFNYQLLGEAGFDALARLADESGFYELVHSNLDEAKVAINEMFSRNVDQVGSRRRVSELLNAE